MSKIIEYIKNYKIGFVPIAVIVFMFSATLYSVNNQTQELVSLMDEYRVTATIGTPGDYITLKNILCLGTLPEEYQQELNHILKQYELELHALLYSKQVPDNKIEITKYSLQYISKQCTNAT